MGRSTAAGIADRIEGVDGRRVLVLTTRVWRGPGVRCTSRDPNEIADAARDLAGDAPIYVCGGAQTYALMMPVVTRALITRIPWSYGCNLHLPSLAGLRVSSTRVVRSDNGSHGLTCYEYRRNG